MKQKTIIKLTLALILALAVGVGGWYLTKYQPKNLPTKEIPNQKIDLSKIPEPKLVAKYEFESQIYDVVFYENSDIPKIVSTEKELLFFNEKGQITKRRKMKLYETVDISKNGEYLAFWQGTGAMGKATLTYTDKNEHVLFQREVGMDVYEISPQGDYLVFGGWEGYIEFVDKYGNTYAKYPSEIYGGGYTVQFSKNGDNCLVAVEPQLGKKLIAYLFEEKGRKLTAKKKLEINMGEISLDKSGEHFVLGGRIKNNGRQVQSSIVLLYRKDKLLWTHRNSGPLVSISENGKYVVTANAWNDSISFFNVDHGRIIWNLDLLSLMNRIKEVKHVVIDGLKNILIGNNYYVLAIFSAANEVESKFLDWPMYMTVMNEDGKPIFFKQFEIEKDLSSFNNQKMLVHRGNIIIIANNKLLMFRIKGI